MNAFLLDLRYSLRTIRKAPGFAIVAVLALAFGIGVNSSIFTLLNAIALRPLPVKNSSEVVTVYQVMRGIKSRNIHGSRAYLSNYEYEMYRDQSHVFTGLAAYARAQLTLGGAGARSLSGYLVSCNYFSVLTGSLALGRGFASSECASSTPVVVLSHGLWKGQFAGDPAILGKAIVLNRVTHTVIGVAPEGFRGASVIGADVWGPLSLQEQWIHERRFLDDANLSWLEVAGRLQPDATLASARADLAVIAARLDSANPGRQTTVLVDHATLMNDPEGRGPVLGVGAVILVAVSLVLVIACANLANLLLARAVGRQKEIAVRLAVGASRWRLIRQLLTESMLLALTGGALGLLASSATLRVVYPMIIAQLPQEVESIALNPSPDIRILLYSFLLAVATGVGFGLIPSLQSSRLDLNSSLKESGGAFDRRSGGWMRGSLITAQVTVCLVLLIAAGLLVRGLQAAQSIDPGFQMKNITVASLDLKLEGYDRPHASTFLQQLVSRLEAQPAVADVALVDSVPLSGNRRGTVATIDGRKDSVQITNAHISPNYFQVLDVPILRGRAFETRETDGTSKAIIVSESTARHLWPNEDPLGKRMLLSDDKVYYEVVGVSKDVHATGLAQVDPIFVYFPVSPQSSLDMSLLVRGRSGSAAVAKAIRAETGALDANVLLRLEAFEGNLDLFQLPSRILSILALALGVAGLLLAALGIYGVMAYAVNQRTREIGIRMTMGAQRADVVRLILAQAMRPVAIGVVLGLAGSAAISGVLSSLLYGVNRLDPIVFGGVSLFLASVALLAGFVPAQRATRIDPMAALRQS